MSRRADLLRRLEVQEVETLDDGTVFTTWCRSLIPYGGRRPPTYRGDEERAKTVRIPLSSIRGTQPRVTREGVAKHLAPGGDLPTVIETETGERLIADGHHRLNAALLRGDQDVQVRLIHVDERRVRGNPALLRVDRDGLVRLIRADERARGNPAAPGIRCVVKDDSTYYIRILAYQGRTRVGGMGVTFWSNDSESVIARYPTATAFLRRHGGNGSVAIVAKVSVKEQEQGRGVGQAIYERALQETASRGWGLAPGRATGWIGTSPQASNVWAALKKRWPHEGDVLWGGK